MLIIINSLIESVSPRVRLSSWIGLSKECKRNLGWKNGLGCWSGGGMQCGGWVFVDLSVAHVSAVKSVKNKLLC